MSKNNTRENILSAGEKLFSQSGYDGVTTKTIALEAGITEMTLFNHFHSKELLYKNIVREKYLVTEIKSVFSTLSYTDIENDLQIIADKIITTYIENKNILKMRLKEKQSFHDDEDFKIERDPLLIQILPIFTMYYNKEEINIEGNRAAILFITTLKGLCHISLLEDKKTEDIRKIVTEYVTIFCLGITNKK
jgi:AcrR family transcriptional regulator